MTVTLTPESEALIDEKVASGLYASSADVIEEALRLLDEQDRLRWLRAAIAEGQRGEYAEFTPELIQSILERGIANAAAGKPVNDAVTP